MAMSDFIREAEDPHDGRRQVNRSNFFRKRPSIPTSFGPDLFTGAFARKEQATGKVLTKKQGKPSGSMPLSCNRDRFRTDLIFSSRPVLAKHGTGYFSAGFSGLGWLST